MKVNIHIRLYRDSYFYIPKLNTFKKFTELLQNALVHTHRWLLANASELF